MLPVITIGNKRINVRNICSFEINWMKVLDNIRKNTGYRLHEIAAYTGCTHTRIQKLSATYECKLTNCEQIALLDLHQDECQIMHDSRILK